MNIGKAKREEERSDDIKIIDRVINNNVVMILDPAGKERVIMGKHSKMWEKELMEMICSQYQEAYLCAEKVKEYIERTTTYVVADEEMVYLCVHIQRLWRASEGI